MDYVGNDNNSASDSTPSSSSSSSSSAAIATGRSSAGRWYQAWQADYDHVATRADRDRVLGYTNTRQDGAGDGNGDENGNGGHGSGNATVCFRVWLTDPVHGVDTWLDAGEGSTDHVRCVGICSKLVRFHEPKGYCPEP